MEEAEDETVVTALEENESVVVSSTNNKKKKSDKMVALSSDSEDAEDGSSETGKQQPPQQHKTRLDKMFAKRNQSVLWEHYAKIKQQDGDEAIGEPTDDGAAGDHQEEEDSFLTLARRDHELDGVPMHAPGFLERPLSVRDKRYAKSKKIQSKEVGNPTRLIYDDEGTVRINYRWSVFMVPFHTSMMFSIGYSRIYRGSWRRRPSS